MDNNVDTITISQNDRFYFSCLYDPSVIDPLLRGCLDTYISYKDIPLLPHFASKLETELIRRSIFGTAALEGNPSSEEDVNRIIDRKDKIKGLSNIEQEISNLDGAYKALREVQFESFTLNEKLIRFFHTLITENIDYDDNKPGKYRYNPCKVGNKEHGGAYVPPRNNKDIGKLMKYFIQWYNSDNLSSTHTVISAIIAHYHLGLIHPFGDGNGRTARLVEASIMLSSGMKYAPFMLTNYYYQYIDEYFWADCVHNFL